ncbi:MAG: substrate-binding domain-containing protein [Gammaproteobacteria bacterium]|nr:substrate-binding domain-containing protein [Gammaproteobacteria bacterium]MDH3887924.1 substrate-binding domain-containing protein [Gammaproteobacteria bacterium]MDH3986397.1 substrate-binding domain-containing protein [Gammaproteobacteria bacterium]
MLTTTKFTTSTLLGSLVALACAGGSSAVFAGKPGDSYELKGPCAFLPADRATEFHGNPDRSKLNLGMAGNQWVVFEDAMQQFNVYTGQGDGSEPAYRPNDASRFTLADLNDNANRYFVELIPPGQIRAQIKSGCMLLGNDEDRNFLPGNFQVKFDVFASTNYRLMKDLANNGFIDEAVPYISNRLDLMVLGDGDPQNNTGNPKDIGNTRYTSDAEFDTQFDIIMDLLSGDVTASSLDHINEGIHNASNNYMRNAHTWVKANDPGTTIYMTYTLADGTDVTADITASDWIQVALANVATPQPGSPGARRLPGSGDPLAGDAGENHTSHDLDQRGCGTAGDYLFCEYAVLNKANTHESRVHHVETPGGIVSDPDFVFVDVGFVWITELAFQLNNDNFDVQGMVGNQDIADLGIPRPAGSTNVNNDITYSLAKLATSSNGKRARQFVDFLRSPAGQEVYTDGGFTGLTATQLDGGRCYSEPVKGVSVETIRNGDGSCDDWLNNN